MVFSYYRKLSAANTRVYKISDRIPGIAVPLADRLRPIVRRLPAALEREDRERVELLCRKLAAGLTLCLKMPMVRVRVHAVRPSARWGELHGLYEPAEGRSRATITLWMRTAKKKRVVAFKAFLRTFLHEFGHHMDYERFRFADSFHTEGFYKRESSLFHQIVDEKKVRKRGRGTVSSRKGRN
jgi:hypothetical protein